MELLFLKALERLKLYQSEQKNQSARINGRLSAQGWGTPSPLFKRKLLQTGWLCVDGSIEREKHRSTCTQRLSAYTFTLMHATVLYFAILKH